MWQYTLKGQIKPKSRPQFNGRQSYLPKKYRDWKQETDKQLASQPIPVEPLESVVIEVALKGKHNRSSDSDNAIGSIFDALVRAGIIRNDNLKVIHGLSVKLMHSKAEPITEIFIYPDS